MKSSTSELGLSPPPKLKNNISLFSVLSSFFTAVSGLDSVCIHYSSRFSRADMFSKFQGLLIGYRSE